MYTCMHPMCRLHTHTPCTSYTLVMLLLSLSVRINNKLIGVGCQDERGFCFLLGASGSTHDEAGTDHNQYHPNQQGYHVNVQTTNQT